MSDKKIILPVPETITLTGQTIDKLIRAGDGDAALLYLYILKTRGQSTASEAAAALGKNAGGIATAMAVLSRLGLIKLGDSDDADSSETQAGPTTDLLEEEPKRHSLDEMKRELESGSVFYSLAEETQRSLGKILSPDELLRLFGMYDALSLTPEVILQLITHCITESRYRGSGRMPSMRYIEKAAYTWEREGVFTLEKAEKYLKTLDAQRSKRGEIKKALQIRDREFSETERRYVDGWIEMGFQAGAVGIAYDRTLVKTGRLAWSYIDTIMKSWHGRGLHTPKEIQEKDRGPGGSNAPNAPKAYEKKAIAPNSDDIIRMEKLLKKIKEE